MELFNNQVKHSWERFYNITDEVQKELLKLNSKNESGIAYLFITHTSCGLTINESYDPSAREDLESFLDHIAPRNLPFIKHTDEGEDDSPSHMKTMLVNQSMSFIVDRGELILGTWQGIYLCEFRDSPKQRNILIKFVAD
ncbi:secondary thiamine-phosphate synthase enzyme YjbQ [Halobacteriovorax marinus]|nr:secondary thiamine-phosphate synthase enzyme YjbQ [Halobacteriovorax marinus]